MTSAFGLRTWVAVGVLFAGTGTAPAETAYGCDFATTDFREEMLDIATLESISVNIRKHRKWTLNALKILTDRSRVIRDGNKKKFRADVRFQYPFGNCVYPAKVRQQGDWKDHIRYRNNAIQQSVAVELKQGNVAGIVAFKLLLPSTRNGDSEVFATQFMRAFGFLAPRTRAIAVSIGETSNLPMLFQEGIEKEMLEAHGRRESAIFEGDERFLWKYRHNGKEDPDGISLARVSNAKWAVAGKSSASLTSRYLAFLQEVYVRKQLGDGIFAHKESADGEILNSLGMGLFELLMIAMGGDHALIYHNRRFYSNSLDRSLEPIYYDGNINLKVAAGEFLSMSNYIERCAHWHSVYGGMVEDILQKLAGADEKKLAALIDTSLFENKFPFAKAEATITRIIADAMYIAKSPEKFPVDGTRSGNNDFMRDYPKNYLENIPVAFNDVVIATNMRFEEGSAISARVDICGEAGCKTEILAGEELKQLFAGRLRVAGRDVILLPVRSEPDALVKETYVKQLGATVVHSPGVVIFSQPDFRLVTITQGNATDWVLIKDAVLNGSRVVFIGKGTDSGKKQGQRFNEFGLTGCLNFYRTRFFAAQISVSGASCEDAVNIVSSAGSIDSVTIDGAAADALDADFSYLEIRQAHISNAGNDCLDFSYGKYNVKTANLVSCGDKGVSIGESSTAQIGNLELIGAAIGVSSKDSSLAKVGGLVSKNVPVCAEAFKKKQEFNGGILTIDHMDCDGTALADGQSLLDFKKANP